MVYKEQLLRAINKRTLRAQIRLDLLLIQLYLIFHKILNKNENDTLRSRGNVVENIILRELGALRSNWTPNCSFSKSVICKRRLCAGLMLRFVFEIK